MTFQATDYGLNYPVKRLFKPLRRDRRRTINFLAILTSSRMLLIVWCRVVKYAFLLLRRFCNPRHNFLDRLSPFVQLVDVGPQVPKFRVFSQNYLGSL